MPLRIRNVSNAQGDVTLSLHSKTRVLIVLILMAAIGGERLAHRVRIKCAQNARTGTSFPIRRRPAPNAPLTFIVTVLDSSIVGIVLPSAPRREQHQILLARTSAKKIDSASVVIKR